MYFMIPMWKFRNINMDFDKIYYIDFLYINI